MKQLIVLHRSPGDSKFWSSHIRTSQLLAGLLVREIDFLAAYELVPHTICTVAEAEAEAEAERPS